MKKIDSVLLVDDSLATNLINKELILTLGITDRVETAKNGLEALDYIKKGTEDSSYIPSLIFLDINMPKMNGFEFLEAYNDFSDSLKKSVVILMLSTSILQDDKDRADSLGVSEGFLSKPLTAEGLRATMRKHFNW